MVELPVCVRAGIEFNYTTRVSIEDKTDGNERTLSHQTELDLTLKRAHGAIRRSLAAVPYTSRYALHHITLQFTHVHTT